MNRSRLSYLLCCCLLAWSAGERAYGWGNTAHRIINRTAVQHLPPAMQQLINQQTYLADHASDADNRKSSDTAEYPKHFLDLEAYPNGYEFPRDLSLVIQQHGWTTVKANGILPWATAQAVDSLIAQARRADWTKAYQSAADIGHYIGDACQPLHCTVNYNGTLTGNDGIHSRYESSMVNQYQSGLTVVTGTLQEIADPYAFMLDRIVRSNALVDSILRADNAAKAASGWTGSGAVPQAYYTTLWEKTGPMTVQLIQEASVAFASLLQFAWTQAGLLDPVMVADVPTLPDLMTLYPNYPNPFNSTTTIPFLVSKPGPVRLTVQTMLGQEVAVLYNGAAEAGTVYRVGFDAARLSTGMYMYSLQSRGQREVRRLLLLR
jgi:hypothetical protein